MKFQQRLLQKGELCQSIINESVLSRSNWKFFRFERQKAGEPVCSGCIYLSLAYDCISPRVLISTHFYERHMVQQGAIAHTKDIVHSGLSLTPLFSQSSELQFSTYSGNPLSPLPLCLPSRLCSSLYA